MRLKAVLDTNVLLVSFGNPDSYLDILLRKAVKQKAIRLYTSPEIVAEFERILEYKFHITRETVVKLSNIVKNICIMVEPTKRLGKGVLRDKDDNKILECAIEAKADIVLTADKELVKLKKYQSISIVHPSMLKYWFKPAQPV